MVPKLFSSGKSFAKLGAYLLHDAEKAKSSERVKWTHTLNLANDHPSSAIDEMLWTCRAADALKKEAGVRSGGKPLKTPVRHFSLNWHESEQPTSDHMVRTVEAFLEHMGWNEHQALIVAHDDKHPHVHVMVNAVHPETGRALDAGFERRRAQKWAYEYEREHGIFCEQRLKPLDEREASPTRESWQRMKLDGDKLRTAQRSLDFFSRGSDQDRRDDEWLALKGHQREQRETFWKSGKEAFKEMRDQAFREIKAEFRHEWKGYFDAKKTGKTSPEKLAAKKADILDRQNKALDERRTEAHALTLGIRKEVYMELLRDQKFDRDALRDQQAKGRMSYGVLDAAYPTPDNQWWSKYVVEPPSAERKAVMEKHQAGFRDAATATTKPFTSKSKTKLPPDRAERTPSPGRVVGPRRVRPFDGVTSAGLGAIGAIATIGERLFDGFFGGTPAAPAPKKEEKGSTRKEEALEATITQQAREATEREEAAILAAWKERRERRRERD